MTDEQMQQMLRDVEEYFPTLLDPEISAAEKQRAKLLRKGRPLAERFGERLTLTLFCREAKCSHLPISVAFGTFGEFREALGLQRFPPPHRRGPSDEELLRAGRRLAAEGGMMSGPEAAAAIGVSSSLISRRFGSWTRFAEKAGIRRRPNNVPKSTDAGVLADVCAAWLRHGSPERFIRNDEFCRAGRWSAANVYRRFGRWRVVADLAGQTVTRYAARTGRNPWKTLPEGENAELVTAAETVLCSAPPR